jgi:hypothetical protein
MLLSRSLVLVATIWPVTRAATVDINDAASLKAAAQQSISNLLSLYVPNSQGVFEQASTPWFASCISSVPSLCLCELELRLGISLRYGEFFWSFMARLDVEVRFLTTQDSPAILNSTGWSLQLSPISVLVSSGLCRGGGNGLYISTIGDTADILDGSSNALQSLSGKWNDDIG